MAELFDVLFNDLRANKKNVNRLLSTGVIFVLVGHFYLVEPYFLYKEQERTTRSAVARHEELTKQITAQLDLIKQASDTARETLDRIRRRINDYPSHLRQTLDKIQRALASGPSSLAVQASPARVNAITLPSEITTFDNAARW